MDVRTYLESQKWTFAKTYANKAPHEYVIRSKCIGGDENFMKVHKFIQTHGILMYYYSLASRYVFYGDYYYWALGDENDTGAIINRAKVSDYKITTVWKGKL